MVCRNGGIFSFLGTSLVLIAVAMAPVMVGDTLRFAYCTRKLAGQVVRCGHIVYFYCGRRVLIKPNTLCKRREIRGFWFHRGF